METMQTIGSVLLGLILRFGLPIGLTVLVCWFFRRMDARWQAEAEEYQKRTGVDSLVPTIRCWLLNDCPPERLAECPAYQHQEIPCWQHFRSTDGQLKEDCIGCEVFRSVHVPIPI